jgi:2-hydroxychromene-2-carboxylate isomerase
MDVVRFYFSFRSPYAWLAFHLAPRALRDLPVELKPIPVFPPPSFPNDPLAVPAKAEYIARHDVPRLAEAYGLKAARPAQLDVVDWMPPHAMWLYAAEQGAGERFGAEIFAARFSRSEDLTSRAVLASAARAAGLDPETTLAAGADPARHQQIGAGMLQGMQDGLFGVPFFTFREERFWGHDRIEWLARSVARAHGLAAPRIDEAAEPG